MVTSDEERQGVGTGAIPAANDAHAPVDPLSPAPETAEPHDETLDYTDEGEASTQAAVVSGGTEEPLPEPIESPGASEAVAEPEVEPAPVEFAPSEEPTLGKPSPPSVPDPELTASEPLSEDEATGRRVESLLAEAPDADPETLQRGRGEPGEADTRSDLEGFELTPTPDDDGETVEEAPPAEPAPIPSITGPSFFDPPSAPQPARPLRGKGMDRVGPIVAFDFDGTLTVRDSFTAFLKWREGSARYHAEMAALAPAALKYLFDRDPGKLKAAAVKRFLAGLPRDVLNEEAMEFATSAAPMLFRPDALRAWRRYRQDGARLMIVTASPENIVAPFARGLGADMLIGTRLIFDQDDRVQGGLLGDNCRGPVKVQRIKEVLGEDTVLAAAYGDTDGDWEMLEMAEQQFMRLFVGVPGKNGGGA